ncbi:MAG: DUF4097 family beta strand repeat-containing protein [Myxococcaceae bacterium]|nr:DUF4097 family beta strand repeat-containing protein [Myxococcaceae bacterium]MCI0669222.1 DUF4097 family beta strand repeat-containing protein [Myxococcaceae bacterium]
MHALLLLALAASPTPSSWQFRTDATPEVSVSNINGSIRVEAGEEDRVTVEARQEGSDEERKQWRVEARKSGNTVEVEVCCGPCGKERRHCDDDSVETHLTLRVPRGAELELSAVNADVEVKGVAGEQEVSTVNGRVDLRGSVQDVSVSTVNGTVLLAPETLRDLDVSTVSGDVKLQLPTRADARLDFSTVGGSFNGRGLMLGSVEETYGKGTHSIDVSTVSGKLEVKGPKS